MSIYEILPALVLTKSVHAKISIGMHRVVKFKISRIPLIGLETRLGWRTDRKFLRNPNLNEIIFKALSINEGETTRGETTQGANGSRGETTRYPVTESEMTFMIMVR